MIFGNLAVMGFLTGLGETKLLMKLNLLTIAIGVPLGLLLIPRFGIAGVIVSAIVAVLPNVAISLYFAWKRYEVTVDFKVSSKILSCLCFSRSGYLRFSERFKRGYVVATRQRASSSSRSLFVFCPSGWGHKLGGYPQLTNDGFRFRSSVKTFARSFGNYGEDS